MEGTNKKGLEYNTYHYNSNDSGTTAHAYS